MLFKSRARKKAQISSLLKSIVDIGITIGASAVIRGTAKLEPEALTLTPRWSMTGIRSPGTIISTQIFPPDPVANRPA